jgi:predicted amidophosphoribosyltransferase
MTFLQNNYCVACGERSSNGSLQCLPCTMPLPKSYSLTTLYHCSHCGLPLLLPHDFVVYDFLGTQRNAANEFLWCSYHCLTCHLIARSATIDKRAYRPQALPYLEKTLQERSLPIHVLQAYERQLHAIRNGVMYVYAETEQ